MKYTAHEIENMSIEEFVALDNIYPERVMCQKGYRFRDGKVTEFNDFHGDDRYYKLARVVMTDNMRKFWEELRRRIIREYRIAESNYNDLKLRKELLLIELEEIKEEMEKYEKI